MVCSHTYSLLVIWRVFTPENLLCGFIEEERNFFVQIREGDDKDYYSDKQIVLDKFNVTREGYKEG